MFYAQCFQLGHIAVKIYPNNKPWVAKHIKIMLNRKKKVFVEKDRDTLREVEKELKRARKGESERERERERRERRQRERRERDIYNYKENRV